MKAQFRTQCNRLLVEVEASSVKALFKALAEAQEIFEADKICGRCHNEDIHFRVREKDEYEFYEMHCRACNAALSFVQLKNHTGLFPKRKDDNGKPLPNEGWRIYDPNANTAPQPAAAKPPRQTAGASK